ncbi:MAG: carboxypeptidase-like regulatory domain-containing protein [bacterium]
MPSLRSIPAALALSLALAASARGSAPNGSITGRVTDESGQPLPWTWVRVLPNGTRALADELGRFHIQGLEPGPISLAFDHVGAQPSSQTLRAGATPEFVTVSLASRVETLPTLRAGSRHEVLKSGGG